MAEYTILEQVKIRLKQFHVESNETTSNIVVFDRAEENPLLEQLISQITTEIQEKRMYPDNYTEEDIYKDMKRFEGDIVNLAVYDYSQAGESYMESYSENGISRQWKDRDKLFYKVKPIARIL